MVQNMPGDKSNTELPESLLHYQDSSPPTVWILILHWRGVDFTRECLISLRKTDYEKYRILLVDNGSETFDGALLGAEFPEVTLLRLDDNKGFAGGCNAGIARCLENGADYVWLLNNDTHVEQSTLRTLVEQARKHPEAGALAALVIEQLSDEPGQAKVAAGRGVIDFVRGKTYLKHDLPESTVACEWVCGANLLLKVEALKKTGCFDEAYFLYFEDTELCHRMRLSGWQCLLVPAARIEHVGGASTAQDNRKHWRSYYHTRNRFLFFHKYAPRAALLPAYFFMLSHLLRHAIVLPFRGENGRGQLRAELLGLRDYIAGKAGKATCLDWCESP